MAKRKQSKRIGVLEREARPANKPSSNSAEQQLQDAIATLKDLGNLLYDALKGVEMGNQLAAQVAGLQAQATESLLISRELRHEWAEAKQLAKLFEQRAFLRTPAAVALRTSLLEATRRLGLDASSDTPEEAKLRKQLEPAVKNARLQFAASNEEQAALDAKEFAALNDGLPYGTALGSDGKPLPPALSLGVTMPNGTRVDVPLPDPGEVAKLAAQERRKLLDVSEKP